MKALVCLALMALLVPAVAAVTLPAVPGPDASAPGRGRADETSGASEPFGVRFVCPSRTGTSVDQQAVVDSSFCPSYVIDTEDLMGQPQLVVDPQNPQILAVHALHGGRGVLLPTEAPAPNERSRHNQLHQPHTIFQSSDGGRNFLDKRYYAPEALADLNRTVFGEDNAFVVDKDGNGYAASLYSWRKDAERTYHWSVAAFKFPRLNRPVNYHENVLLMHHRGDESLRKISGLQLAYNAPSHRVIMFWLEDAGAQAKPSSWIQVHVTIPGEGARWSPIAAGDRVGPCRAITNPLSYGRAVFIGCLPDKGYSYPLEGSSIDEWQIHYLDVPTMSMKRAGGVPTDTPYGTLVDMKGGHMLFVGSGVEAGVPRVVVSKGAIGAHWGEAVDYGARVRSSEGGRAVADARVTAAAYTQQGYLHFIHQERYVPSGGPAPTQSRLFNKTYNVVRPATESFEGRFDNMGFGRPDAFLEVNPAFRGLDDRIFDDLHDSIVTWSDPKTGKERIFTAFGDYGTFRLAEVKELRVRPPPVLEGLQVPAAPVIAPSASANVSTAAAAILTGLMLLRLLAARKKAIAKAPTE